MIVFANVPGLIFFVYPITHLRGILPVYWACKMFSGPQGLIMVRGNWSGHSGLSKKKKNTNNLLVVPISMLSPCSFEAMPPYQYY